MNTKESIEDRLRQMADDSELGYTERFERSAEAFYRKTGLLAPGKSVPSAMAGTFTDLEREEAWNEWCEERRAAATATLREAADALAAAREEIARLTKERDEAAAEALGRQGALDVTLSELVTERARREQAEHERDEAIRAQNKNAAAALTIGEQAGWSLETAGAVPPIPRPVVQPEHIMDGFGDCVPWCPRCRAERKHEAFMAQVEKMERLGG